VLHLDDNQLRCVHDQPEALDALGRAHIAECEDCGARASSFAADAVFATEILRMDDRVDAAAAYARFTARTTRTHASRPRWLGLPVGLGAAAMLALGLFATPLGTYASNMLSIFRPTEFTPINVSSSDLKSIQQATSLNAYGSFRGTTERKRTEVTKEQAEKMTGYTIRIPQNLPDTAGPRSKLVFLQPGATLTFTFDSKKARSLKAPVLVPKRLDGARVEIVSHPSISRFYGYQSDGSTAGRKAARARPKLTFVQMAIPEVRTKGASLAELESFVLSQPQISPEVKAQFEAISDPSHTLPVPVQIDKRTATAVSVDGVSGLAIGDNTGVGAGIMWQKNGMLYVVAGGYKLDELVAVANSLR